MTEIIKIGLGVGVLIMSEGKVLLGLRNPDLIKAGSELQGQGTWTMPGGKVDPGALEPETILEWRWFDFDNLPPNLYNPSKKFIEKYQSGVSYDHE